MILIKMKIKKKNHAKNIPLSLTLNTHKTTKVIIITSHFVNHQSSLKSSEAPCEVESVKIVSIFPQRSIQFALNARARKVHDTQETAPNKEKRKF